MTETETTDAEMTDDAAPLPTAMTDEQARTLVLEVLGGIAPGPELGALTIHDDLRDTLGMDSLDFLTLVTRVSERTGRRIEEDEYERLADLDGWISLLTSPPPPEPAAAPATSAAPDPEEETR
jgi:acyl carrier protein